MGQDAGDTIRWNCKRDRVRLQARYRIQSKIKAICQDKHASALPMSSTLSESEMLTVLRCLEAIITNDISFFSVNHLAQNGHLVQTLGEPLPSEETPVASFDRYMSTNLPCGEDNANLPQPTSLATSKFGESFVSERLVPYMEWLAGRGGSLSAIEYASLLGRHNIVQNMLLGGIDPTRHITSSRNDVTNLAILARKKILSLFHSNNIEESDTSCMIPIELWTYMIRSVIEMRINGALEGRRQGEESNFSEISFGAPCHHSFCEPDMWIHLAEQVPAATDLTKTVVTCPMCGAEFQGFRCVGGKTYEAASCNNTEEEKKDNENCTLSMSAEQRRLESLSKYHCLPSSSGEAKQCGRKKSRKEKFCSTWGEALSGIIHPAQPRTVRSERFFRAILQSVQLTIGYLQAGVDVNIQNEYGQTPLYIACWQGSPIVVKVLLDHGADSSIPANGGSTCYSVAARFKRADILSLLDLYRTPSREKEESEGQPHPSRSHPRGQTVSTLLDPSIDHPGAGAMIIDGAICESHLARLVQIHNSLPLNLSPEGSKRPSRSYFCDAELEVQVYLKNCVDAARAALSAAVPKERNTPLSVFGHIRFLDYTESGGTLPPHVDLSRTDKRTGLRSTHTFILYLTDCEDGGGTALLQQLKDPKVLAIAQPKRGRALIFPHNCPHSGLEVTSPKLLLRGEVIL